MTIDQVRQMVAAANPIPDLELLDPIPPPLTDSERSGAMSTTESTTRANDPGGPSRKPPRRGLIIALAAIAIAVVVGLVVFLPGDDEPDVIDDGPTVTTLAAPVEEPEVATTLSAEEATQAANAATLEAMIATRNAGDFDEWTSYFTPGAEVLGTTDTTGPWEDWQRAVMAANEQWTITNDCSWARPTLVACEMTIVNDFHGPAGIFFSVPAMGIEFDEEGLITGFGASSWNIAEDPAVFNTAFDTWFAATYPEIYDTLGPTVEGEDGLPNAEAMPTALQYVDEFIAQSDGYPVTG